MLQNGRINPLYLWVITNPPRRAKRPPRKSTGTTQNHLAVAGAAAQKTTPSETLAYPEVGLVLANLAKALHPGPPRTHSQQQQERRCAIEPRGSRGEEGATAGWYVHFVSCFCIVIYDVFMHNNAFWSNSNAFSLIICKVHTKRGNTGSWDSEPKKAMSGHLFCRTPNELKLHDDFLWNK